MGYVIYTILYLVCVEIGVRELRLLCFFSLQVCDPSRRIVFQNMFTTVRSMCWTFRKMRHKSSIAVRYHGALAQGVQLWRLSSFLAIVLMPIPKRCEVCVLDFTLSCDSPLLLFCLL